MLKWHDRPFLELTVGRGEKLSQGNNAVCFVPSTKQIVSAGTPVGCLRIWDLRTSRTKGIKISTLPRYRLGGSADSKFFRSTSPATALCVSSDGRTVYGGNSSGDIVGWDLRCIKTPSFGVRAEPQVTSHFNTREAAASDNREYVSNSGVDSCIKSMVMDEHGILVYQTNKGYIGTLNVNELTIRGGKTAGLYQLSAVDNVVSLEKTERLRKQREQQPAEWHMVAEPAPLPQRPRLAEPLLFQPPPAVYRVLCKTLQARLMVTEIVVWRIRHLDLCQNRVTSCRCFPT